jgi:2-oxoisovalerate dehydrogenase E1 component
MELDAIDRRVEDEIAEAVRFSASSPDPDPAGIYEHVYASPLHPPEITPAPDTAIARQSWLEAVRDGIAEEMRRNPNIIYLGEGIAERGGCFAHTKDLWKEFGSRRVIDTPICELAFTGAAVGAAATGCRAIADLMFADFLFEAGSQIVQQAAKLRYMSSGQVSVPLVIRAPMGMIKNAGAHHSGAYYPSFAHIPGLIVVTPSNPADAKGLMKMALRAGDPVLFLEHKALFASKGLVPAGEYLVPFGKANIIRHGTDLTIATCSLLTLRCLEAAERLQKKAGISCEVIDLRTIIPLDVETVAQSLTKTGRLLVVDEAWSMFGVGAELAAAMMELAFDSLDAPVGRLHTERVSFPFSPSLENAVAVTVDKIVAAAIALHAGRPPVPRHPQTGRSAMEARIPALPTNLSDRDFPPDKKVGTDSLSVRPSEKRRDKAVPPYHRKQIKLSPWASQSGPNLVESKPADITDGIPVLIPNMDLTIAEAKIIKWIKQVGEAVHTGETVAEVETDKAMVEIESPGSGVLVKILADVDTVVPLGQPIGIIQPDRKE